MTSAATALASPEKLRAWQSATDIERAAQREKKPESPTGGTSGSATPPKPS
ncbi:MAG: hypothetical protein M3463_04070 [Verrucomicrobiota bacterium]|nr:hypothetical protein [Verrucomicrobiota bacterium]